MDEIELDGILSELRHYLAGPATAKGLIALLERHNLVLVPEDRAEYLEGCAMQCAYDELMEWPAASRAVN